MLFNFLPNRQVAAPTVPDPFASVVTPLPVGSAGPQAAVTEDTPRTLPVVPPKAPAEVPAALPARSVALAEPATALPSREPDPPPPAAVPVVLTAAPGASATAAAPPPKDPVVPIAPLEPGGAISHDVTYMVVPGDTLWKICLLAYDPDIAPSMISKVMSRNRIISDIRLMYGKTIILPSSKAS
jgi:hypothetical protein